MSIGSSNYAGCVVAYSALAEAAADVSDRLKAALEGRFSLAISEFDTLLLLDQQPEKAIALSGLTAKVRLSQPAVSRMADRLERRGLVERMSTADDRRSVVIRLTAEGHALLMKAIPVHAECIQENLLGRLSQDERMMLKTILTKISGDKDEQENEAEDAEIA